MLDYSRKNNDIVSLTARFPCRSHPARALSGKPSRSRRRSKTPSHEHRATRPTRFKRIESIRNIFAHVLSGRWDAVAVSLHVSGARFVRSRLLLTRQFARVFAKISMRRSMDFSSRVKMRFRCASEMRENCLSRFRVGFNFLLTSRLEEVVFETRESSTPRRVETGVERTGGTR